MKYISKQGTSCLWFTNNLQTMVVRLRLARWGRKDLPFYRIVAVDARAPRDGKHLEIVRAMNYNM